MCNKPFSNLNPYLSHLSVSGTVKRVVGTMSINSKSHTPVYYFTKKKHNKPRDLTQAIPCKPLEIFSRSFLVCISVNVAAECSTTIMKKYAGVSLNSTIKHY